jgi:glucokinase
MQTRILAGDIGGTNTRLASFEASGEDLRPVREESYPSQEHSDLQGLVEAFLADEPERPDRACFGVAGPVREGRAKVTNLPWVVDAAELAAKLAIPRLAVINDLEAFAWALEALPESSLEALAAGEPVAEGNAGLISAGTGLGEAGLAWDGRRRRPFATEGGHASFAPGNELEIALLRHLAERHGHVSWERVASGPGLVAIHDFSREHRSAPAPAWLADELAAGDPAAAISRAALDGRDEIAAEALDLFVRALGAEAGNLALKVMATAGVYLGGGIAPKIRERLRAPDFLEAFRAKGRMRPLLETMPVILVLDEGAGLLGSAIYAAREL